MLNKPKQLKRLGKDTTREDFCITVSPSNKNVNIECSTGFYAQVVIPGLKDLIIGSCVVVAGVTVACTDIVGKVDAVGSNVNTVLHFRLQEVKEKAHMGSVVVHLHHSTRLVQVQGGVLPDKSSIPVWFVEHFLIHRLSKLAASQSQEISAFNQAVRNMLAKSTTSDENQRICGGCKLTFDRRSVPEFCTSCAKHFHKHKCFTSQVHQCPDITRSRKYSTSTGPAIHSSPGPPLPPPPHTAGCTSSTPTPATSQGAPAMPSQTTTISTAGLARSIPFIQTELHPTSQYGNDNQVITATAPVAPLSGVLSGVISASSLQQPSPAVSVESSSQLSSVLNPSAPCFTLSDNISQPPPSKNPPKQTGTRRKTKMTPPSDPQGIELDFAKYSLNTAKAKIVEQETEINDLKFRNKILDDRIASLENREKDQINRDIFNNVSPASCCKPRQCCNIPPPTMHYCCPSSHHGGTSSAGRNTDKFESLSQHLSSLSQLLSELSRKVDTLLLSTNRHQTPPEPTQLPPTITSSPSYHHQDDNLADVAPTNVVDTSALSLDYEMSDITIPDNNLNL